MNNTSAFLPEKVKNNASEGRSSGSLDNNRLSSGFLTSEGAHPSRSALMTRKNILKWLSWLIEQEKKKAGPKTALLKSAERIKKSLCSCGSRSLYEVSKYKAKVDVKLNASSKGAVLWSGMARCEKSQDPVCLVIKSKALVMYSTAWTYKNRTHLVKNYNCLLTFTRWHSAESSLSDLYDDLDTQLKSLSQFNRDKSRNYSKDDFRGHLCSLEATKADNGVHVHWHVFYTTPHLAERNRLETWYFKQRKKYNEKCKKLGMKREMPKDFEQLGFKVLKREKCSVKKVLNYINKGLWETTSSGTKEKQKKKGNSIFSIESKKDLLMFIDFCEVTSGKQFYRASGVCKGIRGGDRESKTIDVEKMLAHGEMQLEEQMRAIFTLHIEDNCFGVKTSHCNKVASDITEQEMTDLHEMTTYVEHYMSSLDFCSHYRFENCPEQFSDDIHKDFQPWSKNGESGYHWTNEESYKLYCEYQDRNNHKKYGRPFKNNDGVWGWSVYESSALGDEVITLEQSSQ